MIVEGFLIHSTVLVTGAVVSARVLTRKPQPIETLVSKLDLAFVARVAEIASNDSIDVTKWHNISLLHLNSQAMLLTRIAIELSKHYPEEFGKIPDEQKCSLGLMRFAALMCLLEDCLICTKAPHVNAMECARSFLRIFDATEMLIVRYDARAFGI